MRKNSTENTRINMEVQRELSEIIWTEIKGPRVSSAMIMVVAVEVVPDLKCCKAYISMLGSEEAAAPVLEGLKNTVGYVRKELARRVNLWDTLETKFVSNQSIEYGVVTSKLTDNVTKNLED